jgi:transcription initiation factor IIE alpha subunit
MPYTNSGIPYVNEVGGTSYLAAVGPRSVTAKARILTAIREAGEAGLTDEEIEIVTGIDGNTVRPRRGELRQERLIRKKRKKLRRLTRTENLADVWVAL